MRIVFFTHYFPPEVNAPANRTYEHCRAWAAAGHEVHVITCTPSHPLGRPFEGYTRAWYRSERLDGVHVHRVWTYLAPNRGVARRTVNYLSYIPTSVWRALRLGSCDVVLSTSPQFFCAVAAWIYTRLRRERWIFELRDLWPDSIPAVGAMRKSAPLKLLERFELRMYRDASAVVSVTRSFIENLVARGIDRDKLHFIPNGIVPQFWDAGDRAHGRTLLEVADDDVVVSYVGTIGMAHGLQTTLDAAALLRDRAPSVKFVIVGDGAELGRLRAAASDRGLTNVRFMGLRPREQMPSILAASDVALVTLKPSEIFKTVLPSKMFEAMAAGRAVVLAVDGEARLTLEGAGAGMFVPPGDAVALSATVERLAADHVERGRMGAAGAGFVGREFNRAIWAAQYLELLESTAARPTLVPGPHLAREAVEEGTQP